MGRRSQNQTLGLWANGQLVGHWTLTPQGDSVLQYDAGWVSSAVGRPISLSLPFNLHNEPIVGPQVAHYFENLLPDSDAIRRRIALRFNTGSTQAFALLAAIGRDCVGALQLLPQGEQPGPQVVDGVALSEANVERYLLECTSDKRFNAGLEADDDFRISLAGAQEKSALLRWNGQWMKPRGTTPTTHILKMPLGLVGGRQADFSTSVDNEWLCMQLLKAYGLPVAHAEIATFGRQRVLVVERFDRVLSQDGQYLLRLVQEDFCQVTGTSPLRKYENEGGPGLQALFEVVRQSQEPEADAKTIMAAQVLFWMLRAPDGHAKNFSIQIQAGASGRFKLTPLYDVMSAYPVMGNQANQWAPQDLRLAMALLGKNRHYHMQQIQRRHFNSTAKRVGYGKDAEDLLQALIAATPQVVERVQAEVPKGFSQQVLDTVLSGVLAAAKSLESQPS